MVGGVEAPAGPAAGTGGPHHPGVARSIHRNTVARVIARPTEVAGPGQRPVRVDLRHETIGGAVRAGVEAPADPVARRGLARHPGIARGVQRNAVAAVAAGPAEVAGPGQRPVRVDLCHKGVADTMVGGVEAPAGPAAELGGSRHPGIARGIHRDAETAVVAGAAQVAGPGQGAIGVDLRHEGIAGGAVVAGVEAAASPATARRRSACHPSVARRVDRDAEAAVIIRPPDVTGPGQGRSAVLELVGAHVDIGGGAATDVRGGRIVTTGVRVEVNRRGGGAVGSVDARAASAQTQVTVGRIDE